MWHLSAWPIHPCSICSAPPHAGPQARGTSAARRARGHRVRLRGPHQLCGGLAEAPPCVRPVCSASATAADQLCPRLTSSTPHLTSSPPLSPLPLSCRSSPRCRAAPTTTRLARWRWPSSTCSRPNSRHTPRRHGCCTCGAVCCAVRKQGLIRCPLWPTWPSPPCTLPLSPGASLPRLQVRRNAAALGTALTKRGYKLVTGGTGEGLASAMAWRAAGLQCFGHSR